MRSEVGTPIGTVTLARRQVLPLLSTPVFVWGALAVRWRTFLDHWGCFIRWAANAGLHPEPCKYCALLLRRRTTRARSCS